jgi:hypothetical protein
MGKVSIGLRGWRFDEGNVFDENGEFLPFDEMPEDTRHRLVRLSSMLGEPCSACWLVHGEEDIDRCNTAEIVYGEPLAEVVLCSDHEPDFLYWFREEGGREHAGSADLAEEFHAWFSEGGPTPEGYAGLEHVDRDPEGLPDVPPDDDDGLPEIEEQLDDLEATEREALDVDFDDVDV